MRRTLRSIRCTSLHPRTKLKALSTSHVVMVRCKRLICVGPPGPFDANHLKSYFHEWAICGLSASSDLHVRRRCASHKALINSLCASSFQTLPTLLAVPFISFTFSLQTPPHFLSSILWFFNSNASSFHFIHSFSFKSPQNTTTYIKIRTNCIFSSSHQFKFSSSHQLKSVECLFRLRRANERKTFSERTKDIHE